MLDNIKPIVTDKELAETLELISNVFKDHVKFQNESDADTLALWVLCTYLIDQLEILPFIYVTSPEPMCGKSTVLKLLKVFSKSAQMASKITSAAIYRLIERDQPTLLFDEADRFLRGNSDLNGILNAGHARFEACVIINEKQGDGNWEPKEFSVWCAKAVAGIGAQDDTLVSRSIVVPLRRKLISETVKPVRFNLEEQHEATRQKLAQWASQFKPIEAEEMESSFQAVTDRATDNWISIAVLARRIQHGWQDRAYQAFKAIEIDRLNETQSIGIHLLSDIRSITLNKNMREITSSELYSSLLLLDESEWYCLNHGKEITKKWLTQKLLTFGIKPVKRSHANVFLIEDLQDAFDRYLPPID